MFFNKASNRVHILTLLLLSSAGPVCESDFLPGAPGPSPQLISKHKTTESPSTATSFIVPDFNRLEIHNFLRAILAVFTLLGMSVSACTYHGMCGGLRQHVG